MILGLGIDSWITIATLVALMAALLFTRLRTDVVFWGVIGILFVTGVLDKSEAFSGLINSSVIIVGVMFVIVTGLSRTGVLLWMTKHILGNPKSPVQILLRLMLSVGLLSSFVNNTSVVALFVGGVKLWSRKLGINPSKLLIPNELCRRNGWTYGCYRHADCAVDVWYVRTTDRSVTEHLRLYHSSIGMFCGEYAGTDSLSWAVARY